MRLNKVALLIGLLGLLVPHAGNAQSDSTRARIEHRNVVSANPFLLLATWFNAEYEHRISNTATIGVRASTLNLDVDVDGNDDGADYYSGRAFWRYYPNGAYTGFFFGIDAGVTGLDVSGETNTVLGAGFELGYNWLLGEKRNFYLSLGIGADRLFGGDLGDASAVIPTVRIVNIGFAF